MIYKKELKQKYETDVFVAGGGAAGIAAAVAAKRAGARVFLAEASGAFGGLGTIGMVPAFAPFTDGINFVADGIGMEIRKRVSKDVPLDTYFACIDAEELKREYDKFITAENISFSFFTTVCDVICRNRKISAVVCNAKSGMFTVKAKIYIDCTGDGDLCALGGGAFELGDENGNVMPQTLCSLWTNIDEKHDGGPDNIHIDEAFRDGVFKLEDRHLPGFFHRSAGIGGGNIGHTFGINPIDEVSLTKAMLRGRESMSEYETYYKNYLKGFKNMKLCTTANVLGIRESRRIVCDYMLVVEDFKSRAVFDDEIGRYCYPVDTHIMKPCKEAYDAFMKEYTNLRYNEGESYGIPYRSLIPVSFSNVLVAGRCIGCDRQMQASVRVMPSCFLTGQAAGTAAAIACESENVRTIAIDKLQSGLLKLGAYLPNKRD